MNTNRCVNVVNGVVTISLEGNVLTISPEHTNYKSICSAIQKEEANQVILDLYRNTIDLTEQVDKQSKGRAQLTTDGSVMFDDKPINSTLAKRVTDLAQQNLPFEPILRFLENLDQNSGFNSVEQLFDFLDNIGLYITEDGCFLAYKAVRADWTDKWSGKVDNSVGEEVSMPRNKVDDNRGHQCSKGYHVGGLKYIGWFGNGNDRIIIVKVNPKDAVSVPTDYSMSKLRVCRYEVLREYEGELNSSLYKDTGDEYPSDIDDWDDWDDCDYDDEYDEEDDYEDDYEDDIDEDLEADIENEYNDYLGFSPVVGQTYSFTYHRVNRIVTVEEIKTGVMGQSQIVGLDCDQIKTFNVEEMEKPVAYRQTQDTFGKKPDGTKFHNQRDSGGRFAPRK